MKVGLFIDTWYPMVDGVIGLAGLALIPFLHHLGFSLLLLIVTGVF